MGATLSSVRLCTKPSPNSTNVHLFSRAIFGEKKNWVNYGKVWSQFQSKNVICGHFRSNYTQFFIGADAEIKKSLAAAPEAKNLDIEKF